MFRPLLEQGELVKEFHGRFAFSLFVAEMCGLIPPMGSGQIWFVVSLLKCGLLVS